MSKSDEDLNNQESVLTTAKGIKSYINSETDQSISVFEISKKIYGYRNFWKFYFADLLVFLGITRDKQLEIFFYILEHTNPSNHIFLGTYNRISKDTGCSSRTIAKVMIKLQKNHIIQRIQNGAWAVSPDILINNNDNLHLLITYSKSDESMVSVNSGFQSKKLVLKQKKSLRERFLIRDTSIIKRIPDLDE